MIFDPEARTLTLEPTDCRQCSHYGPGTMARKIPCPTCSGTGKGPRGGARGCRDCSGFGHAWDHDNPVTCSGCNGDFKGASTETFCDNAPVEALASLQRRTVALGRENTWNESYLGHGTLFSVTDYGDMAKLMLATAPENREAVAWAKADERGHLSRTQAVKILKPYERGAEVAELHDMLVLCITRNGWHIRAMSDIEIPQEG